MINVPMRQFVDTFTDFLYDVLAFHIKNRENREIRVTSCQ